MAGGQDQGVHLRDEVGVDEGRHIREGLSLRDNGLDLELDVVGLAEALVVVRVRRHYGQGQEILSREALVAFAEPRFHLLLSPVQSGGGARVVDSRELQQADDGARVDGPPFRGGRDRQHGSYAFGFQSLKRSRSTFLSNFPTEVLGTASMKRTSSGSHHLATSGLR